MRIELTDGTISVTVDRGGYFKSNTLEEVLSDLLMPAVLALGYEPKLVEEHMDPDAKWAKENLSEENFEGGGKPFGELGGEVRDKLEQWWAKEFKCLDEEEERSIMAELCKMKPQQTVGDLLEQEQAEIEHYKKEAQSGKWQAAAMKANWEKVLEYCVQLETEAHDPSGGVQASAKQIRELMLHYYTPEDMTDA